MTTDYVEVNEAVEVPRNTGIRGFMHTIESILKLPRVQRIEIDSRGKVSYTYFARREEEHAPLRMNFSTLMPYAAVRNGVSIDEIRSPNASAALGLGQLFEACAVDRLFPVAFVAGTGSKFWDWAEASLLKLSSREELFGLPFLTDDMMPNEVLILAAAFAKDSALVDTRKSYKLVIPTLKAAT